MIIEFGVVITKKGRFWGVVYNDGGTCLEGWLDDLDEAEIYDPRYCTKPTDITCGKKDARTIELDGAELVRVERRTETVPINETGEEG
jgi:hypothetical protein